MTGCVILAFTMWLWTNAIRHELGLWHLMKQNPGIPGWSRLLCGAALMVWLPSFGIPDPPHVPIWQESEVLVARTNGWLPMSLFLFHIWNSYCVGGPFRKATLKCVKGEHWMVFSTLVSVNLVYNKIAGRCLCDLGTHCMDIWGL